MRCAKCREVFSLREASSIWNKSVQIKKRRSSWLFRIVIILVLACSIGFLAFVAERNDWLLSISELPEQIEIAFHGSPEEQKAMALSEPPVVEISEVLQNKHKDGDPIWIVSGTVTNASTVKREQVIIRGQIVESDGDVAFESSVPCGRVFLNRRIRSTPRDDVDKLWIIKRKKYNCTLAPKGIKKFQLVFEDIPPGYKNKYSINAKATYEGQEQTKQFSPKKLPFDIGRPQS